MTTVTFKSRRDLGKFLTFLAVVSAALALWPLAPRYRSIPQADLTRVEGVVRGVDGRQVLIQTGAASEWTVSEAEFVSLGVARGHTISGTISPSDRDQRRVAVKDLRSGILQATPEGRTVVWGTFTEFLIESGGMVLKVERKPDRYAAIEKEDDISALEQGDSVVVWRLKERQEPGLPSTAARMDRNGAPVFDHTGTHLEFRSTGAPAAVGLVVLAIVLAVLGRVLIRMGRA